MGQYDSRKTQKDTVYTLKGMRHADNRLVSIVYLAFVAILVGTLVTIFYASPLRERVEAKLFDIRTRMAPALSTDNEVVVVGIGERTIKSLEGEPNKDLTWNGLLTVCKAALGSKAKQVIVLVAPQVFNYSPPVNAGEPQGLELLATLAAEDPRLRIGLFGVTEFSQMPLPLIEVRDQVVSADIGRTFRRNVIRNIRWNQPHANETPDKQSPQIPSLFAAFASNKELPSDPSGKFDVDLAINWLGKSQQPSIEAADIVNITDSQILETFKDRVVLIGYSTYRPSNLQYREATFVNTPWQSDGEDVKGGIPVVALIATVLTNILDNSWLNPPHDFVAIVQTIVVTSGALAIWAIGSGIAAFGFLAGWTLLIAIHAMVFSTTHHYVDLADTLLFSCLATTAGGFWRLRVEARLRAMIEAQEQAELQIAEIQDRFLDRFANELARLNQAVRSLLVKNKKLGYGTGSIQKIFSKAMGSCDELAEYLDGIRQFAKAGRHSKGEGSIAQVPLKAVNVRQTIEKVINQFENRLAELDVKIEIIDQAPNLSVEADATLLAQILYNLISNAVKYSPRGGLVTILIATKGNRALIGVQDRGPGIAPELHERIFEKFYRVKDDYVYRVKGHGLGLYLSRFFAAQIGALILIDSAPGKGSTFTLETNVAN